MRPRTKGTGMHPRTKGSGMRPRTKESGMRLEGSWIRRLGGAPTRAALGVGRRALDAARRPLASAILVLSVVGLCLSASASAGPIDLSDRTPRWVEVRLEVSPEDAPGRLDSSWSPPLVAFLEPAADDTQRVHVRIPSAQIEAHLDAFGTDIVPGSFSEFVWTLDAQTGHVVRAAMQGRVREQLKLGFLRTETEIDIAVEMSSRRTGGFRTDTRLFGLRTHRYCAGERGADAPESGCVLVPGRPLDPRSGYVNAVGTVEAEIPLARHRVFSPLGEARFSERAPRASDPVADGTPPVGLGPPEADAVCSRAAGVPCGPASGGETWSLDRTPERPAAGSGAGSAAERSRPATGAHAARF